MVTTHDWSVPVDEAHLRAVRRERSRWADGGVNHLVLEVLAYALDEVREGSTRSIDVVAHPDGWVTVRDDGRGTDTRQDGSGVWWVKPVMATRDLRFTADQPEVLLADGRPRGGMSVVAALSERLEHTNVRADGAWSASYEHGIPVGPPAPVVPVPSRTGTTVRFRADPALVPVPLDVASLRDLLAGIDSTATITCGAG